MNSKNPPPDSESRRKATIICSTCDRSAPIGDRWHLKRNEDKTEIECPNCGTVVVSQPTFDSDGERRPLAAC
jgi:DNA-directed RNA polymerase subunit RPC12/RpoP